MDSNKSNMMRYIFGALGLIGILALSWWGIASSSYSGGKLNSNTIMIQEQVGLPGKEPTAKACSGCGPNGCSATASSWDELRRKIFGNGNS